MCVTRVIVSVDIVTGKDVSDKDFMDAFGFRGVQFGNWVKQRRSKNIPKFPKKMVDIESQSSKKSLDEIIEENSTTNLDKVIPQEVSTKQNGFILPLELSVKDGKVTLDWKDFNKLIESI